MRTCYGIENCPKHKGSVITMGTFDGVHRGHQKLIKELTSRAAKLGLPSILITFHPHPQHVLKPEYSIPLRLLTTIEEKEKILKNMGIDYFVVVPFNREISRLSAEEFLQKLILPNFMPRHFIIGHDHHFGRNRSGDSLLLTEFGKSHAFDVSVIHPVLESDIRISSTEIRKLLRNGELEKSNKLLGYNYLLMGTVVRGDGRGKDLGFPTANIKPINIKKQYPARGVYLVSVEIDGKVNYGMCNIGIRPTFGGEKEVIEVHILSENNERIYDKHIELSFIRRIRDEKTFASPENLIEQLQNDKQRCEEIIKKL